MVTGHLIMKLFPAKCHGRAILRKLWRPTGNSSLSPAREMLTAVARHLSIKWLFVFHRFDPFVLLYDKSLNDWSLGEQWILFPEHLNVSRDEMLSATYSQFFFLWKNLLVSPVTSAKNILTDKIPAFLRAFKVVISMCTTAKRGTWVGLLVKPS